MQYRRVLLNYALCNCHTPTIFLTTAHLIKSCPTTERLKQLLQTSPVVKLLNFPHQYVFILLSQLQPGAHLLCSSVNTKVAKPHAVCERAITALCRPRDVHPTHTRVLFLSSAFPCYRGHAGLQKQDHLKVDKEELSLS